MQSFNREFMTNYDHIVKKGGAFSRNMPVGQSVQVRSSVKQARAEFDHAKANSVFMSTGDHSTIFQRQAESTMQNSLGRQRAS